MEQVGCSVVAFHCAAVYRDVYVEQLGCPVVMFYWAAVYVCVFVWSI